MCRCPKSNCGICGKCGKMVHDKFFFGTLHVCVTDEQYADRQFLQRQMEAQLHAIRNPRSPFDRYFGGM